MLLKRKSRREFLESVSGATVALAAWPGSSAALAASLASATGYLYDDRYLLHVLEADHVESPPKTKEDCQTNE